jgi:DNA-binding CsgD family transcriptional regulator
VAAATESRNDRHPETGLFDRAVGELARDTGFPVTFGGMLRGDAVHVSAVSGARTTHLRRLVVQVGRGLGGRAVIETRPRLTLDYRTAKGITHDYDQLVLGEGIATLFAVPVMVAGTARGVLYCGSWGQASVGHADAGSALRIARELAARLGARDQGRRDRPDAVVGTGTPHATTLGPAVQEELRETYAQLRRIVAEVDDAGVRRRLRAIGDRLATLTRDQSGVSPADAGIALSPRETDVLACVALGSTNAQIAATLGVKEVTVKSYLASAMSKLDAATRHSAVVKARRAGILP